MLKRLEVECGVEEDDTEEKGVYEHRASMSKVRREGQRGKEEVEGGKKPSSPRQQHTHPEISREAAEKSRVAGEITRGEGKGVRSADAKLG